MKKRILIAALCSMLLMACKKENTQKNSNTVPENKVIETKVTTECYQGIIKKDTILLSLNLTETAEVSGKLSYKFFEKDKNEGTIRGTIKGDTLMADYTFKSEGVTSIRQVVFLKKGNGYIEGFGPVEEENGNMKFQSIKKIQFDGKIILSKIACID